MKPYRNVICKNCPLRKDKPSYLSEEHGVALANQIEAGHLFECHLSHDPEDIKTKICGASLQMLEKNGDSDLLQRYAAQVESFRPGTVRGGEAYDSLEEMKKAHLGNPEY